MKVESIWQHKGLQKFGLYLSGLIIVWGAGVYYPEEKDFGTTCLLIGLTVIFFGSLIIAFRKAYRDKKAYLSIFDDAQELCVKIDDCWVAKSDAGSLKVFYISYNYEIDEKIYMFCTKIVVDKKEAKNIDFMIGTGMQIVFVYNRTKPELYTCIKPEELYELDQEEQRIGWTEEKKGWGGYISATVIFTGVLVKWFFF